MSKLVYPKRFPELKLQNMSNIIGAEIGVGSGGHAFNMLSLLNIVKLYLIDPYISYGNPGHGVLLDENVALSHKEYALQKLELFDDKIIWLMDYSSEAVKYIEDGELDFIYIDGNHRYKYVKKDLELYYPKVKDGGWIAGHDYKRVEKGVIKAVNEFFDEVNTYGWEWWVEKQN